MPAIPVQNIDDFLESVMHKYYDRTNYKESRRISGGPSKTKDKPAPSDDREANLKAAKDDPDIEAEFQRLTRE